MLAQLRRVIAGIPKGKVSTYGSVAAAAGYPGAARQVAWALHHSSAGLPWHRVLGAGGRIRLPGESGMEQRLRLQQEGVAFSGSRVIMERHEAVLRKRAAWRKLLSDTEGVLAAGVARNSSGVFKSARR
jgi:methylated-DNA-protein-cysteine methyltransferase related protein